MIGVTSFLKNVILVNQYSYQEFYDTFNMEELAQWAEQLTRYSTYCSLVIVVICRDTSRTFIAQVIGSNPILLPTLLDFVCFTSLVCEYR